MIMRKLLPQTATAKPHLFSRDKMYYSRKNSYSKTVKGITAEDLEDVSKEAFLRGATLALCTRILRRQRYNNQLTLQFQKPINECKFSEQSA